MDDESGLGAKHGESEVKRRLKLLAVKVDSGTTTASSEMFLPDRR
jgi:hypothetical protein